MVAVTFSFYRWSKTPCQPAANLHLNYKPPRSALLQKMPAQAAGLQAGGCRAVPGMLTAALTLPSRE